MARAFRRGAGRPGRLRADRRRHLPRRDGRADRGRMRDVIRARAGDVTRFVATSDYYADRMAEYLDVPREQIDVVYPGIAADYLRHAPPAVRQVGSAADGRLPGPDLPREGARPADRRDALLLRQAARHGGRAAQGRRLRRQAGREVVRRAAEAACRARPGRARELARRGRRDGKLALLDSDRRVQRPDRTTPRPRASTSSESLARGVPVVQPAHGSFPELMQRTGGGVLVAAGRRGGAGGGAGRTARRPEPPPQSGAGGPARR